MKTRRNLILAITAFGCLGMGLVDAVIQPGYAVKSAIKLVLFLVLPVLYAIFDKGCDLKRLFIPNKKGLLIAAACGLGVYGVILGGYYLLGGFFDFSGLTTSLTASAGVDKDNFLFVALYISFINSLLEEFFFRGFAFLTLKRVSGRKLAYIASSLLFALYHVAMMIGWFSLPLLLLVLLGLFVGGVIFCFFNERYDNIYLSWLIHMFANFAINTIGMTLFAAQ